MTTVTIITTVTITTRARNLGYGWSSTPTGVGCQIEIPTETATGGLRTVEHAMERAHRICSGGVFWREAMFVGGRRVLLDGSVWGLTSELRRDGYATVRLADR